MAGFVDTLTSKAGPLPVWAYGVLAGGVVGIFIWRSNREKAKEATDATDAVSSQGISAPGDEGLVDTAGWGASPYPQAASYGMPASLADDSIATIPVNPQTGNPYAVDVALPINPATNQPYQVDYSLGERRQADLEAEVERLKNQNEQLMNQPPIAYTSPGVVDPQPPAPVVTTPAPPARATLPPIPPKGTVVWTGANRPDQAVINKFIAEKYGRPVSWRTVDNGAGKTPRYKVVTQ